MGKRNFGPSCNLLHGRSDTKVHCDVDISQAPSKTSWMYHLHYKPKKHYCAIPFTSAAILIYLHILSLFVIYIFDLYLLDVYFLPKKMCCCESSAGHLHVAVLCAMTIKRILFDSIPSTRILVTTYKPFLWGFSSYRNPCTAEETSHRSRRGPATEHTRASVRCGRQSSTWLRPVTPSEMSSCTYLYFVVGEAHFAVLAVQRSGFTLSVGVPFLVYA